MSIVALDTSDPDPKRATRTGLEQRWRVVAVLARTPAVDIVIPAHNEETELARTVHDLHAYLEDEFPFSARITIADGASTDGTLKIAAQLAADLPDVRLLRINENGRGRALAAAWLTSDAGVVAQLEVGAKPELAGLLPMIEPIVSGDSDLSIGRPSTGGDRTRAYEAMGRFYSVLLRLTLGIRAQDVRWRIRALRADVARHILPTVGNRDWLSDTELMVRAERAGFRINRPPTA